MSALLRALAIRGQVRNFRKNQLLIQEGDRSDTLIIILSGKLRAFASDDKYRDRELTFGVYGPGEYVGEMSLDGGPRSASVIAVEATRCAVVTRKTLEAFIAEQPGFAFELIAKLIWRARAATLSAKHLALNDVYGRIRLLLESRAVQQPDGTARVAERLLQRDIGDLVGSSSGMVNKVMKQLVRGGYVDATSTPLTLLRTLPDRF
jgi:CRP/FNR family cyclic AMP-dependent transcriptional regulator